MAARKACTVVLRGSTNRIVDEAERSVGECAGSTVLRTGGEVRGETRQARSDETMKAEALKMGNSTLYTFGL